MKWREVLRMPVSEATRKGAEQMARLLRTDVRDLFAPRAATEVATSSTTIPEATVVLPAVGNAGTAVALRAEVRPRAQPAAECRFEYEVGEVIAETFEVRSRFPLSGQVRAYRAKMLVWEREVLVVVPQPAALEVLGGEAYVTGLASRWVSCGLHPHMQYCFESRVLNGVPCLVLESPQGTTLRSWMAAGRCQPLRVSLNVAIQICQGMAHAHERGLFHGALIPEYIFVSPAGTVTIANFGLALPRDEMLDEAYVAPERWVDATNPASGGDVFALGICLYELLCGQRPYEVTRGPRREAGEPIRTKGEPLPASVAEVLRAAVDWEPVRRPSSVREIRDVLCAAHEAAFGEPSPYARVDLRQVDASGWNNQGMVLLTRGDTVEAEAAWQAALAHDPRHLEANFNLAMLHWRTGSGSDQEVLAALERAASGELSPAWTAYLAAQVHLEAGNGVAAKPYLEQAAESFAGTAEFEELLKLARRSRPLRYAGKELRGHSQYVSAVAISADGRWLLSGSDDHTVVLWDVVSGHPIRTLEGHEARIASVAMTPDATTALTGSDDLTLRLWDLRRGRCENTLFLKGKVFCVALSADGRRAVSSAAGSDNFLGIDGTVVALWDLERGRVLREFEEHTSAVKALALTPDGRYLATGSDDQTARVWDTVTGRSIRVLRGHTHNVSCVALSADGKRLVTGSWDRTVRVWDVRTGRCLAELRGHAGIVTAVCLDAEGNVAVSGSWDGSLRVWDLESNHCIRALHGHRGLVTSVALAPSAQVIASGSWDNTVRLWDLPHPGPKLCRPQLSRRPVLPPLEVEQAALEELVRRLDRALEQDDIESALGCLTRLHERGPDDRVDLRQIYARLLPRVATGRLEEVEKREEHTTGLNVWACDAQGGQLVVLDDTGTVRRWSGGAIETIGQLAPNAGPMRAVAASPDLRWVACAGLSRVVHLVGLAPGEGARELGGHTSVVRALAWCGPRLLASGSYDRTIRIWEVPSGQCVALLAGHDSQVRCLAADAQGKWLASGDWSGEVRVWDAIRGACVACVRPSGVPVSCLRFVGDDAVLVGSEDGSIAYWRWGTTGSDGALPGSAQPRLFLGSHDGAVLDLAALWDGQRVVSAGADGQVRLWEVARGTAEAVLHTCAAPALGLLLSPDARELTVQDARGIATQFHLHWALVPRATPQ